MTQVTQTMDQAVKAMTDREGKYLTFGTTLNTDYILGMAKMDGGVKILLNIDRVLNREEVSLIENAA